MNTDGLWAFNYYIGNEQFAMLGTFNGTKITGGNSCYYYIGDCEVIGDTLKATIKGTHYFGALDPTIGGLKEFTMQIQAKQNGKMMQGTAQLAGLPIEVAFTATKVA